MKTLSACTALLLLRRHRSPARPDDPFSGDTPDAADAGLPRAGRPRPARSRRPRQGRPARGGPADGRGAGSGRRQAGRRAVVPPRARRRRKAAATSRAGDDTRRPPAAKPTVPVKPSGGDDGLVGVVALVFDQLGPDGARNARAAALQFAERSFPKGSLFSVYKVGQGLQILQAFTEDRKSLPAAIEKATRGIDQARDPARRAGYDNATEEAFSMARDAQAAFKGPRSRRAVHGDAGARCSSSPIP